MSGQRATWAAAQRIQPRLSQRDHAIIGSLARTRVLTGQQLTRLHFDDLSRHTQDRTRRRVVARLTGWQVLARLDRSIGGVRAGSTGWVYCLGPIGQRLIHLDAAVHAERIRTPWTPSLLFLQHSLAVAEVYVRLSEQARQGGPAVRVFQTEPACWWPDGLGGWLKPDAYLELSAGSHADLIWLEIDRGTQSLPTLKRKLQTYAAFAARGQQGPSSVLPYVVIATTTAERAAATAAMAASLPRGQDIFRACTLAEVATILVELATQPLEEPP